MDALLLDLRYARRSLRARPAFSAVAVFTLAIGIGVNTVAFSALDGLVHKPMRFPGARELGWIMVREPGNPYGHMSLQDFDDLRRDTRTLESVAAEARMPMALRMEGATETVWTLLVSADYFHVMRAQPRYGRLFGPSDRDEFPVVVSERFWNERLGGGRSLAGRTLTLNGRDFSIVGVMPDGFQGPGGLFEPALWVPLERHGVLNLSTTARTRGEHWLTVVGRMKTGVSSAQAGADLQAIAARLAADYPATNKGRTADFAPVVEGNPEVRSIARYGWMGLGVIGIVLVIACFNVAGLLLARAADRQREIGVRAALGASRARILRQMLTEGLLLAALGGAAAVIVSIWSADLLAAFSLPSPIPQRLHMRVDPRVVAFTAVLAAVAGLLPALVPAFKATRANVLGSVKLDSPFAGARRSRLRNLFVIAQIAGSTLFLAAALLVVRSFANLSAYDPGFDADHTLTIEVTPAGYGYDVPRTRALVEAGVERLSSIAGVAGVAVANRAPFFVGMPQVRDVPADGQNCAVVTCRSAFRYGVGRSYFGALGVPILAGRDFTDHDLRAGAGAIVSATMASELWPDGSAVGRSFRDGRDGRRVEVIGIAGDVTLPTLRNRQVLNFYRPLSDDDLAGRLTFVLHTAGDPRTAIAAARQQLQALDADVPVYVQTMAQRMEVPMWPWRTAAGFLLVCGTLALVLATVGLFGVTYYAVSQRTREFGVRVALGATRPRVMALVLKEGVRIAIPGVVVGAAAAFAAARLLSSLLVDVSPGDPLTYGAAVALQIAVALAACALPAYRATRVDPIVALRSE